MSIVVRRATKHDIGVLVRHRIALRADHFLADADVWRAFGAATAEAYAAYLDAGEFFAWIADDRGAAIGSVGMLLRRALPRLGGGAPYDARVQSMWGDPAMRRRGVGRALIEALLAHARALDVRRVELHTSAEGALFYPAVGFAAAKEMERWLDPASG